MAGIKISDATPIDEIKGSELLPVADGGAAKNLSTLKIAQYSMGLSVGKVSNKIIDHKAGVPENSKTALLNAIARGSKNIHLDIRLLGDGSAVCMHDETVDRVTDGTGNLSIFDAVQFKNLKLDASIFLSTAYQDEEPLFFEEALQIAITNSNATLWVEAKDLNSCKVIVSLLKTYNAKADRVVIQSSDINELNYAIKNGYPVLFMGDASLMDFANLYSLGVKFVGSLPNIWTETLVNNCKIAGLIPVSNNINSRYEAEEEFQKGIEFVFSDDSQWLSRNTTAFDEDCFIGQKYLPGLLNYNNSRAKFLGDGKFGFDENSDASYHSNSLGCFCPIKNDENANEFEIYFKFCFNSATSEDSWMSFFICPNKDILYLDNGVSNKVGGYHLLIRKNGTVQIYLANPNSTPIKIAETIGDFAFDLDNEYSAKITVTPSEVKLETLTFGKEVEVLTNDTSYRGGYLSFGKSGVTCYIKDVVSYLKEIKTTQAWLEGASIGEVTNNGPGVVPLGYVDNNNFDYLAVVDVGYNFIEYEFIFDRSAATSGTSYAHIRLIIPCTTNILLNFKGAFEYANLSLEGGANLRVGDYQLRNASGGFISSNYHELLDTNSNYVPPINVNFSQTPITNPNLAQMWIFPLSLIMPFGSYAKGRFKLTDLETSVENV